MHPIQPFAPDHRQHTIVKARQDTPRFAQPRQTAHALTRLGIAATLVWGLGACAQQPPADHQLTTNTDPSCGTTTSDGSTVDGSTLWAEVPGGNAATTCDFYQFSLNNLLWSIRDDGTGHPKFMSFVRWDDALPSSGEPDCTLAYEQLDTTELTNKQAFDDFELLDVTGATVEYDIRINGSYCDYILSTGMYTETAFDNAVASFDQDPASGGIWLPEGDSDSGTPGAIEIKNSWRSFGASEPAACQDGLMHCEQDEGGDWWGLLGMHFAQKTPEHGEMIWASYEHAANAPDCEPGGNNPIARDPVDPTDPTSTFNVNEGLDVADVRVDVPVGRRTGWSFFDLDQYEADGGDPASQTCTIPTGSFQSSSGTCINLVDGLCNTDPQKASPLNDDGFGQINVCRRDQLPPTSDGCDGSSDEDMVACLNSQVLASWPEAIDEKWQYYFLIGAEWMTNTLNSPGVSSGAPTIGCFDYSDPEESDSVLAAGTFAIEGSSEGDSDASNTYQQMTIQGFELLANTTMETWFQEGSCFNATNVTVTEGDCFSCHQPLTQSSGAFTEGGMSHLFSRISNTDSDS